MSASPAGPTRRHFLIGAASVAALAGCGYLRNASAETPSESTQSFEVSHPDAEWKQLLTAEQYDVLRQAGTEAPFSSPLDEEHGNGVFSCVGCHLDLFASSAKFDSGTGWPSFWQPLDGAVIENRDDTLGMSRTEVLCRRCGGHLGHVFDDGPDPTGLRYCMNGVAMDFRAT